MAYKIKQHKKKKRYFEEKDYELEETRHKEQNETARQSFAESFGKKI